MILEESKYYSISYIFNNKEYNFSGNLKQTIGGVVNFLSDNNFKFDESFFNKPITYEEIISNPSYKNYLRSFFKMNNNLYFYIGGNTEPALKKIINMLSNFGIDESSIKTNGFETETKTKIKKFGEIENDLESKDFIETKSKKMTFLVACQFVLKQNDNRPMNAKEIWEEINKQNLTKTNGLTPWDTINAKMILSSINTTAKGKKKNSIFQIIEGTKPYKFILLNPDNIQNVPDEDLEEIIDGDYDVDDVENFSKRFGIPTDFKASQSQEEKESPKKYIENPFRQSICILGKSGAGKSWTIDDILDKSNHEYEFIIPSASTTGLLSQFSPSAKEGRGGYIPSRLGKLIEKAYKNNSTLYTVVFDECHKSNIIEMINDELLQAISTERNKNRFISLDDETSELYPSKILDRRGNIEITDNLGFIFISSNARVISGNDDFFNRVDLVEITKESRDSVKTIEDLNRLRISDTDKKYELVSKIMSESKR